MGHVTASVDLPVTGVSGKVLNRTSDDKGTASLGPLIF